MKLTHAIHIGIDSASIATMKNGEPCIIRTDTLRDEIPMCVAITNKSRVHDLNGYAQSQRRCFFISKGLRIRYTVEFLSVWESVNNPAFNYGEFAIIKSQILQAYLFNK